MYQRLSGNSIKPKEAYLRLKKFDALITILTNEKTCNNYYRTKKRHLE